MTNVLSILRVLFGFKILFWLVQSLLLFIFSVFFVKPEIFMDLLSFLLDFIVFCLLVWHMVCLIERVFKTSGDNSSKTH